MAKYRKRPVIVEALQFSKETWSEICDFVVAPGCAKVNGVLGIHLNESQDPEQTGATIMTLEGDMAVAEGDWIIKGVQDEFYPCKPDIFAATYEPVS